MALDKYTNSNQILNTTEPTTAIRYTTLDLGLLDIDSVSSMIDPQSTNNNYAAEFHVYTPTGTWVTSNYRSKHISIPAGETYLQAELLNAFNNLNILRGEFKFAINVHHNWVGNESNKALFIKEISPDRDEVHLVPAIKLNDADNPNNPGQDVVASIDILKKFITKVKGKNNTKLSYFALNFGQNNIFKATNFWFDDNYIYVKLYEPLPDDIAEKQRLWIVSEVIQPYIDNVIIYPQEVKPFANTLRKPNFELDVQYGTSTETDFKSWNNLLDTTAGTSQQIIDKYFSGSLSGVTLGIDYTDFNNFINYSSAEERIKNFRYKVRLIEYYDDRIRYLQNAVLGSDSGSLKGNIVVNEKRKDGVIGGFDQFENWLYNEPTASLTTHGISGSLTPWPKYVSGSRYYIHHVTASAATTWYDGNIASASRYDADNGSALVHTIPDFISNDLNNDQFMLFVNMTGHHFDILWSYIKELTDSQLKEEQPKLGVSNELLYDVAKTMGWQLTNGKQLEQLWQYKLGKNVSGSFQSTGSLFSKSGEELTQEVWRRIVNNLPYILKTKGTARSIKALMSAYGIPQTLLSIREYGGPRVANIKPALIEDRFTYAVRIESASRIEIPRSTVDVDLAPNDGIKGGDRPPDTIEFRFKPKAGSTSSYTPGWQYDTKPLLSYVQGFAPIGSIPWSLGLQHTGSVSGSNKYGRLVFTWWSGSNSGQDQYYISSSTAWAPLFDGDWWNARIWTNTPFTSSAFTASADPNIYFQAQKSADCSQGKIIHRVSASLNLSSSYNKNEGSGSENIKRKWDRSTDDSKVFLGGWTGSINSDATAQPYKSMFTGAFQEYREYMELISDATFDQHTLNPTSYTGNNPTSSYYTLVRQYTLGTDVKAKDLSLAANIIISSSHPNQHILDWQNPQGDGWNSYATASNFPTPSVDSFNREVESYYIQTPSIGGSNLYSEKIRSEANKLVRQLSPITRGEQSQYDLAPIDSNKLGLFYSAQDQINKDIFNELGFIDLDDYIGDPADQFKISYPDLNQLAQEYWKKFTDRNDINAYIRIFSLFDFSLFQQIKQLLPARVKPAMGLLVEPSILERSKATLNKRPVITNPQYEAIIEASQLIPSGAAQYLDHSASLTDTIPIISSNTIYHTGSNAVEAAYSVTIPAASPSGSPHRYCKRSLIRIPTGSRARVALISESLAIGAIPAGATKMPMYINAPTTRSWSYPDPCSPTSSIIDQCRKSYIYKRKEFHYGPKDNATRHYKLNKLTYGKNAAGFWEGYIKDDLSFENTVRFYKLSQSAAASKLEAGTSFSPRSKIFSASYDTTVNGGLFPTASHNYFVGPMMHFSSSTSASAQAASGNAQKNGMEYVRIPSLVLGNFEEGKIAKKMGGGDWSISFLAREDVGHTGSARYFIGGDVDADDEHPNKIYPRIGFNKDDKFYFETDKHDKAATVASSLMGLRDQMHHYVITCKGVTGSLDSMSIDLWVDGIRYVDDKLMAPTTTSIEALGGGTFSSAQQYGFSGLLGQVRFYDGHKLTTDEIYWLNLYPHLRANRDNLPDKRGRVGNEIMTRRMADLPTSSSLVTACYRDDKHTGWENICYNGSKLTGQDFNIDSPETIDGGPVVSFIITNPNQLMYQSPGAQGSLKVI